MLTDDVVDEFVVCARYDELPRMLASRFGAVADGIVLPPLRGDSDVGIEACVAALAAQ